MDSTRDANRVHVKLKLSAGTYILQTNRAAFNQNDVKPTCLLCNDGDETLEHFLLFCKSLETVRKPKLGDLCHELSESVKIDFGSQNTDTVRLLMDCSYLVNQSQSYRKGKQKLDELSNLEYQCRRLTFALHNMRFQELSKLNTRRR